MILMLLLLFVVAFVWTSSRPDYKPKTADEAKKALDDKVDEKNQPVAGSEMKEGKPVTVSH